MDIRNWGFSEWKDAIELIAIVGGIVGGVALYMNRLNQIPDLADQTAKMQESINKIRQDAAQIPTLRDELKKIEDDKPEEIPDLRSRLTYLAEFDCKVHQKQCLDILSHFDLSVGSVKKTNLSTGEAKIQTPAGESAVHFISGTRVFGPRGGETTVSKTQNRLTTYKLMAIYNYNTRAVVAFVANPTVENASRPERYVPPSEPHAAPSYQGGGGDYVDPDTGRKLPSGIRTLR